MSVSKTEMEAQEYVSEAPMATPTAEESTTIPILSAIKECPKVIFYCVLMTVGPLIFGFDTIIVGVINAMPAFQSTFGSRINGVLILPALWLALWNAFVQIGCMIGSVANGPIADRFGRKVSFMIGGLVGVVAVAVIYTSDLCGDLTQRRGAFLAGKTILGITLGMLTSTCQTYISEVAPARLRGPLLSMFTFFLVLGQLIAISIVFARIAIPGPSAYRVAIATQWAFAGFAILVGALIPESPMHLLRKAKVEQARKAYARLYHESTIDSGLQSFQTTLDLETRSEELYHSTSYRDCFQGSNWRRTRIIIYANVLQQCLGVSLLANSTYFLELGGLTPTNSIMITEVGISLGLPANVISWFAMTIFGRRAILMASTAATGLLWTGIGIAGCFHSSVALWFIGIAMMTITFVYGLGVGGAYPVVGAESSSVRLRAKSQSIGFIAAGFSACVFNFCVPYIFDAGEGNLGGKTGFVFTALCILALVVIYFEIPEMKNRSYRELDEMFEQRLSTRAFKKHVCETAVATEKIEA